MYDYRFEFFKRRGLRGTRWYFRFRAPNGRIMFSSEGYKNIEDAQSAVHTIKREAIGSRSVVTRN